MTSGEETTQVTGERVRLTLSDASLKAAKSGDALADLKSIVVDGGRFVTTARTVVIDTLAIKGGRTTLTRVADGTITLLDAFSPAHLSNERAAMQEKGSSQRWKYVVHAADVSDLGVTLSARGYQPAVRYDIEVAAASKNIAGDAKSPIELKAALRVAQGGTVNCSGTLAQDFMRASVKPDAVGVAGQTTANPA